MQDPAKLEAARRLAALILANPGRYPELLDEATSIAGPAVAAWLQNADPAVVADKARILKTVQAGMKQFFTSV